MTVECGCKVCDNNIKINISSKRYEKEMVTCGQCGTTFYSKQYISTDEANKIIHHSSRMPHKERMESRLGSVKIGKI